MLRSAPLLLACYVVTVGAARAPEMATPPARRVASEKAFAGKAAAPTAAADAAPAAAATGTGASAASSVSGCAHRESISAAGPSASAAAEPPAAAHVALERRTVSFQCLQKPALPPSEVIAGCVPYGVTPLESFVAAAEGLEPSTAHSVLLRETLPFVQGSKSFLVLVSGIQRLLAAAGCNKETATFARLFGAARNQQPLRSAHSAGRKFPCVAAASEESEPSRSGDADVPLTVTMCSLQSLA